MENSYIVVYELLMNKNDFYYVLSTKLDTQIVVFWWGYVGKNILLGGK